MIFVFQYFDRLWMNTLAACKGDKIYELFERVHTIRRFRSRRQYFDLQIVYEMKYMKYHKMLHSQEIPNRTFPLQQRSLTNRRTAIVELQFTHTHTAASIKQEFS